MTKPLDTMAQPAACCSPLGSPSMSDEEAGMTATVFKALSDRHRVRIVNLLANSEGAVCVCDITETVALAQPTVSFHLKKLTDAGLLSRERRGTWAYYAIERDVLARLRDVFEMKEPVS
jgi:ArsR family transcriptional regulator, arsenate/arsenite/antimonite-responsive transcriptional repressor